LIEEAVLNSLMTNDEYFNKVYDKLDKDLFTTPEHTIIYEKIKDYVKELDAKPTLKEIALSIKESNKLNANIKKSTLETFKELAIDADYRNLDFLFRETLNWIKKQKLTKAIFTAADIIQADEEFEPIIDMVENALEVNFDTSVGLNYNESIEARLSYYKSKEVFTPIGLKNLNNSLGGGIRPGSLFLLIGTTHSGKTSGKVFITSNLLYKKENVLFLTLEMPELEIAKRIDANMLGYTINELEVVDNNTLLEKYKELEGNIGKLVIKEYGAGTFSTLNLKSLLNELKTKQDFIPDAIVIDYLGLMVSHRATSNANSYEQLGKVAEDLHAIAKETYNSKGSKGIKMITSSQANRSAFGNVEAGMDTISESLKIAMTADVAIMLITTEQMKENKQQLWKIVKNRYTGKMDSLLMNVDFSRMMYYSIDEENEKTEDIPTIDTGLSMSDIGTSLDLGSFNF